MTTTDAPAMTTTIAVHNPVTGALLGELSSATAAEVQAAVARARSAQRIWQAVSLKNRLRLIEQLGDALWAQQRAAMDVIRAETGRNDTGALSEIIATVNLTYWLKHHAPRILQAERRRALFPMVNRAKVYHKPYGVVGAITPWNYPLLLVYIDVLPALAAGNTVVIKPSEIAPYSAQYVLDLMNEIGFPLDTVQIVNGDSKTGAALIACVDFVSFTGSTAVGAKIATQAAARMIPYCLELGGKGAMIVLKDADLDWAAHQALLAATESTGQMCISVERVYVEAPIYDAFIEKVRGLAHSWKISAENGLDVHIGSMTTARGLERVEQQVADAVAKGAKLVYGGKRRPDIGPLFYEPAVLAACDHTMAVMTEETFGPVLPIMCVQNEAEAVRLANNSLYGLSSSIYTRDLKRAEHLAMQLETGDVGINRTVGVAASPELPWGGRKHSGVGRRGGREGLLRFTVPQSVYIETTLGSKPSLQLLDPLTLRASTLLMRLRKHMPFI
ncbi:MAG: aldehyde dehydrogenase family protein [Armatimonadetes bacterium]|nr:aldehyde dehydrogenase family protein [Anaerolineae bacterium]